MPVASDKGGGSFQLPPAGTHLARCIWVIDLGTHRDVFGKKEKLVRKVRIGWELPNEKATFDEERGEESFMCGQDYTLSLGERANLRHMLESWRGQPFTEQELKGFELGVLIRKACMVNLIHRVSQQKRTYSQVASVTPLPKGLVCPKVSLETIVYDIWDGENEVFAKLPEWIQERIEESEEWNTDPQGEQQPDPGDDSPPPDDDVTRALPRKPAQQGQGQPPAPPPRSRPQPPQAPAQQPEEDDIPF